MNRILKRITKKEFAENKSRGAMQAASAKLVCLLMAISMLAATGIAVFAADAASGATARASYSTVSSKVNSTINTAKNRITQLYDLDTQLLQSSSISASSAVVSPAAFLN